MKELSKWIPEWELRQEEDWTPVELLSHIRAGLPAYDGTDDRRIYDVDILPRHKKPLEEIAKELRQKFVGCDPPASLIEHAFKNQTGTPIIPPDCYAMSFALPTNRADTFILFDKIKSFKFKRDEVTAYEQAHGLHNTNAEQQQDTTIPAAPIQTAPILAAPPKPEPSYFSELAKKNKGVDKSNKPILTAVIEYMKENPKRHKWENSHIAKSFCGKYSEKEPRVVILDGIEWDIYCKGDDIIADASDGYSKKLKKVRESRRYTTLLNNYIPKAKKAISSDISK